MMVIEPDRRFHKTRGESKMNKSSKVACCTFDEDQFASRLHDAQMSYQRIIHELTQVRRKKHLSQSCIATKMGVKQPRISEIEKLDTADVSFLRILLLAEFLDVEVRVSPKVPHLKIAMMASKPIVQQNTGQQPIERKRAASAQKVRKSIKSQA
jgi:predicted XRE-type DNA-binding protein